MVSKDHKFGGNWEMVYSESNGHVTDDVKWPWKAILVTPIRSESNIAKTAGDAILQQSLITK